MEYLNDLSRPARCWTYEAAQAIHDSPFADLLCRAHGVHRSNFDPNAVQRGQLLSMKTGGCPENCGYCSHSAHYQMEIGVFEPYGLGNGDCQRA